MKTYYVTWNQLKDSNPPEGIPLLLRTPREMLEFSATFNGKDFTTIQRGYRIPFKAIKEWRTHNVHKN